MNEAAMSGTGELSPAEWHALDSMLDDIEPVEEVARAIREAGIVFSADEFLATMLSLFRRGFITIRQAPIPAFDQEFSDREITPLQSSEIVGDLDAEFRATYAHGDYLRRVSIPADSEPAGVPFGIYFNLTSSGRAELQCRTPKSASSEGGAE